MAVASRDAAVSAPGVEASRSPTSTTAPGADRAVATSPPSSSVSAVASAPGAVCRSRAAVLTEPGERNGAIVNTLVPTRRTALRSRRKTIGDSSSGSKPASSTAGACSRSAYVTTPGWPAYRPATWAARKSSSSSLCARTRLSTSLVWRQTRANLA